MQSWCKITVFISTLSHHFFCSPSWSSFTDWQLSCFLAKNISGFSVIRNYIFPLFTRMALITELGFVSWNFCIVFMSPLFCLNFKQQNKWCCLHLHYFWLCRISRDPMSEKTKWWLNCCTIWIKYPSDAWERFWYFKIQFSSSILWK